MEALRSGAEYQNSVAWRSRSEMLVLEELITRRGNTEVTLELVFFSSVGLTHRFFACRPSEERKVGLRTRLHNRCRPGASPGASRCPCRGAAHRVTDGSPPEPTQPGESSTKDVCFRQI